MDLDIIPSAGMLFPGPVPIRLAGGRYRAAEFRVRHVARIERAAARLFDHPFAGMEDSLAACDALPAKDPERERHMDALFAATDCWPPRLGTSAYYRALMTAGLAPLYLRLALRPTRPRLTAEDARTLAGAMTGAEWLALDRVAHGTAPRSGEGDGRGFDWRAAVKFLTHPTHGRCTMAEVEDLYLTQLFFLCTNEPSYQVRLPDRPESVTSAV